MGSGTPAKGGRSSTPTAILSPSRLASPLASSSLRQITALRAGLRSSTRCRQASRTSSGLTSMARMAAATSRAVACSSMPARVVPPGAGSGWRSEARGAALTRHQVAVTILWPQRLARMGVGASAVALGNLRPEGGACSSSTKSTRWWGTRADPLRGGLPGRLDADAGRGYRRPAALVLRSCPRQRAGLPGGDRDRRWRTGRRGSGWPSGWPPGTCRPGPGTSTGSSTSPTDAS